MNFERTSHLVASIAFTILAMAGCNSQNAIPVERFQVLIAAPDRIYRIDSFTGEIQRVESDGMFPIVPFGRIKLEIGRIYKLEDDTLVAYEGAGKFGSATEAILKRYSPSKQ